MGAQMHYIDTAAETIALSQRGMVGEGKGWDNNCNKFDLATEMSLHIIKVQNLIMHTNL